MIDKNLLLLINENKKYIYITVLFMLVSLLASVAITASICFALYLLMEEALFSAFFMPLTIALFCILLRFYTSKKVGDMKDLLGRNVKKELRAKVYEKIIKLGTRCELSMAGLTQVALEGIEQLDLYYSTYIPQFYYAMLAPFILFFISIFVEWKVALVLLLCVPFIPISIVAVSKYAKKIFAKYWGKYTSMGDGFLDSVQGLKELKIFQADAYQHHKMNENAEAFRKITMKVLVMQLFSTTIMDLVAYGGAGLGIALSIYSVAYEGLHPIAGLFLILVAVDFFLPLRAFGSAFHIAMNGASAGKKIIDLLASEEAKWNNEQIEDTTIDLKNITFSYDEERTVLKNISMHFEEKGFHAIVGESGCGKSTIVNLILGSYRSKEGKILIGKKELETLSRDHYYNNLSVVSYNTYIFNTTIKENFKMVNKDVKEEEIKEALQKVNLLEFVYENGGLDKVIKEDAINISGGQKQRLALAIALIKNASIYIFDEATSNIDIESEAIIMENIKSLSKDKNVIVISHRLENIVKADNIFYMEKGQVTEVGTHTQLLKKNGGYAKLYLTQKHLEQGYREVA